MSISILQAILEPIQLPSDPAASVPKAVVGQELLSVPEPGRLPGSNINGRPRGKPGIHRVRVPIPAALTKSPGYSSTAEYKAAASLARGGIVFNEEPLCALPEGHEAQVKKLLQGCLVFNGGAGGSGSSGRATSTSNADPAAAPSCAEADVVVCSPGNAEVSSEGQPDDRPGTSASQTSRTLTATPVSRPASSIPGLTADCAATGIPVQTGPEDQSRSASPASASEASNAADVTAVSCDGAGAAEGTPAAAVVGDVANEAVVESVSPVGADEAGSALHKTQADPASATQLLESAWSASNFTSQGASSSGGSGIPVRTGSDLGSGSVGSEAQSQQEATSQPNAANNAVNLPAPVAAGGSSGTGPSGQIYGGVPSTQVAVPQSTGVDVAGNSMYNSGVVQTHDMGLAAVGNVMSSGSSNYGVANNFTPQWNGFGNAYPNYNAGHNGSVNGGNGAAVPLAQAQGQSVITCQYQYYSPNGQGLYSAAGQANQGFGQVAPSNYWTAAPQGSTVAPSAMVPGGQAGTHGVAPVVCTGAMIVGPSVLKPVGVSVPPTSGPVGNGGNNLVSLVKVDAKKPIYTYGTSTIYSVVKPPASQPVTSASSSPGRSLSTPFVPQVDSGPVAKRALAPAAGAKEEDCPDLPIKVLVLDLNKGEKLG